MIIARRMYTSLAAAARRSRLNCPEGPVELRENYSFAPHEAAGIAAELQIQLEKLCSEWERIHGFA